MSDNRGSSWWSAYIERCGDVVRTFWNLQPSWDEMKPTRVCSMPTTCELTQKIRTTTVTLIRREELMRGRRPRDPPVRNMLDISLPRLYICNRVSRRRNLDT